MYNTGDRLCPKRLGQLRFTHLHILYLSVNFLLNRALIGSLDEHLHSFLARCKMLSCIMKTVQKPRPWGSVRIELFPDLHLALGQPVKLLCQFSKCYRGVTCVIHRLFVDYMNKINFSYSSTYLP